MHEYIKIKIKIAFFPKSQNLACIVSLYYFSSFYLRQNCVMPMIPIYIGKFDNLKLKSQSVLFSLCSIVR